MSKSKVLVCVLTGLERQSWINPDLCQNVFQMACDSRFEVNFFPVKDARPWDVARNVTMHVARQVNADWLVSFDNDNFTHGNPLDIIATAGPDRHVIGLRYGIGASFGSGRMNGASAQYSLFPPEVPGANSGPFQEVPCVAGGVLMIRNTVWKKIPKGPWFRWQPGNGELLDAGACGEDMYFSNLVRQHGFKVWTHAEQLAGHYRTTDITAMTCTLAQLSEHAKRLEDKRC